MFVQEWQVFSLKVFLVLPKPRENDIGSVKWVFARGVECWRFQFLKILLNQRSINDISLEILLEEVKFIQKKQKARHITTVIHPSTRFFLFWGGDITPD